MQQDTKQDLILEIEEIIDNEDHKDVVLDPWRDQINFASSTELVLAKSVQQIEGDLEHLSSLRNTLDLLIADKRRTLGENRQALAATVKYKAELSAGKIANG